MIEIGNDFFNMTVVAKCQNKQLLIKKVFSQKLKTEALEKFIPKDPVAFGNLILDVLQENKIPGQRVAILLPSDTCYTRLIDIPENVKRKFKTIFRRPIRYSDSNFNK